MALVFACDLLAGKVSFIKCPNSFEKKKIVNFTADRLQMSSHYLNNKNYCNDRFKN
jgi:hypothetical protein